MSFLLGEIRSEFNGPVERIDVVNECVEAIFLPGRDEEDVAPPNPRTTRG